MKKFLDTINEEDAKNIFDDLKSKRWKGRGLDEAFLDYHFEAEAVVIDFMEQKERFFSLSFAELKIVLIGHFPSLDISLDELQALLQEEYSIADLKANKLKKIMAQKAQECLDSITDTASEDYPKLD